MIWIYALLDHEEKVIYIGQNSHPNPEKRLRFHVAAAKRGQSNMPILNWIRKHGEPGFGILEVVDTKAEADEAERRLIREYREKGVHLFNVTEGGGGQYGVKRPEHGNKLRGRKNPAVAEAGRKRWAGMSHAEKRVALAPMHEKNPMLDPKFMETWIHPRAMLGKRHSEETLKRMSKAQSGSNNAYYGRKHSEEVREKMRGPRKASCYCMACQKCRNRERARRIAAETREAIVAVL